MYYLTERTLVARLNRALHKEGLRVRTCPYGSRAEFDLGRHYVISTQYNVLSDRNIDLEDWARSYGVLRADEQLVM